MSTADATLLPPPPFSSSFELGERESVRHLDAIGVDTVLGAMIEQKRRSSRPSFPAFNAEDLLDDDADDGPATHRAPTGSDIFVKAR